MGADGLGSCRVVVAAAAPVERAPTQFQQRRRTQPDLPVGEEAGGDGETAGPVPAGGDAPQPKGGGHHGGRREQHTQQVCGVPAPVPHARGTYPRPRAEPDPDPHRWLPI